MTHPVAIFIFSGLLFLASYLPLRRLKDLRERRRAPAWTRLPAGFLAWAAALSALGMAVGVLKPFVDLLSDPNMGSAFEIVGLAILIGAIAKLLTGNPELLDLAHTRRFWESSLVFDNHARRMSGVFEDLDRHQIRKVFKEVHGREMRKEDGTGAEGDAMQPVRNAVRGAVDARSGAAFSRDTVVRTDLKEVKKILEEPRQSPRFAEEMQQLKEGTTVDLTDSWKLLSANAADHRLFAYVHHMELDPSTGVLAFRIRQHLISPDRLAHPERLFRLKQDTYDFFQVVSQELWMRPYVELAASIACTWYYKSDEVFAAAEPVPLFRSSIPIAELKANQDRFFNPNDLSTDILST